MHFDHPPTFSFTIAYPLLTDTLTHNSTSERNTTDDKQWHLSRTDNNTIVTKIMRVSDNRDSKQLWNVG
jgi:hypothetical protein